MKPPAWVLGLDISAASTGCALVCSKPGVIPVVWTVKAPKEMRSIARARYQAVAIQQRLDQWSRLKGRLEVACVEGYPYVSFKLAVLVEVGAILRMSMQDRGLQVYEVAPMTLKKFVVGKADRPGTTTKLSKKAAMRSAVLAEFGPVLPVDPNEDEVDALGLAWLGAALYGSWDLTDAQYEAIETVQARGPLESPDAAK